MNFLRTPLYSLLLSTVASTLADISGIVTVWLSHPSTSGPVITPSLNEVVVICVLTLLLHLFVQVARTTATTLIHGTRKLLDTVSQLSYIYARSIWIAALLRIEPPLTRDDRRALLYKRKSQKFLQRQEASRRSKGNFKITH